MSVEVGNGEVTKRGGLGVVGIRLSCRGAAQSTQGAARSMERYVSIALVHHAQSLQGVRRRPNQASVTLDDCPRHRTRILLLILYRFVIVHTLVLMSGEKRPAADTFGSTQLVKRAKSDAHLNGNSAVTVANGPGQHGALIQAVCIAQVWREAQLLRMM